MNVFDKIKQIFKNFGNKQKLLEAPKEQIEDLETVNNSSKAKSFREEIRFEPKVGILDALTSLGLDPALLDVEDVKANILFDAGRKLGLYSREEVLGAELSKEQIESLRQLVGENGSYGKDTLSELRHYGCSATKNQYGKIELTYKQPGNLREGSLRDTDIFTTHVFNPDGIEMEYISREYLADIPYDIQNKSLATVYAKRNPDMITQTYERSGSDSSAIMRRARESVNGVKGTRNDVVMVREKDPQSLVSVPNQWETRTDDPHPFDREIRLRALHAKTGFDFRNYPAMPKGTQQVMEKIEEEKAREAEKSEETELSD